MRYQNKSNYMIVLNVHYNKPRKKINQVRKVVKLSRTFMLIFETDDIDVKWNPFLDFDWLKGYTQIACH